MLVAVQDLIYPRVLALALCLAGAVLVFSSGRIQQYGLNFNQEHKELWATRINPFRDWMKTRWYRTTLVLLGLTLVSLGLVLFILSIRRCVNALQPAAGVTRRTARAPSNT